MTTPKHIEQSALWNPRFRGALFRKGHFIQKSQRYGPPFFLTLGLFCLLCRALKRRMIK